MLYKYQILNIPWVNSTVEVWPDGQPENKTRLVVINLRGLSGVDEVKLVSSIKSRFGLEDVTVEVNS